MVEKYRGGGDDDSSQLLGGQGRSGKSRGVRYEQARVNLLLLPQLGSNEAGELAPPVTPGFPGENDFQE